jgi:hypothetical protein
MIQSWPTYVEVQDAKTLPYAGLVAYVTTGAARGAVAASRWRFGGRSRESKEPTRRRRYEGQRLPI